LQLPKKTLQQRKGTLVSEVIRKSKVGGTRKGGYPTAYKRLGGLHGGGEIKNNTATKEENTLPIRKWDLHQMEKELREGEKGTQRRVFSRKNGA